MTPECQAPIKNLGLPEPPGVPMSPRPLGGPMQTALRVVIAWRYGRNVLRARLMSAVGVALLLMLPSAHADSQAVNISGEGRVVRQLTSEDCPVCDAARIQAWQELENDQFGISGRDMLGHTVGFARRGDRIPYLPDKQTICGQLHQFKYNWDGDQDWYFNIVPVGHGAALFEDAKAQVNVFGLPPQPVCSGGICVHGEIVMDQEFPTDDFFRITWPSYYTMPPTGPGLNSDVVGQPICVYGVWLKDANHSDRPEIHPTELVWWRGDSTIAVLPFFSRTTSYHAMFLQDDSNRFDRNEDFTFEECFFAPPNSPGAVAPTLVCIPDADFSRPWAKWPRQSELRFRFREPARETRRVSYTISERYSRNVVTPLDASVKADEGPGVEYDITFDGVPVITLIEEQPDDHVGVVFDSLCYIPGFKGLPPQILGQIVLRTKYGVGDRGGEGFQVLDLRRAEIDLEQRDAWKAWIERGLKLSEFGTQAVQANLTTLRELIARWRPDTARYTAPRFQFVGPLRSVAGSLVADIVIDDEQEFPQPRVRTANLRVGQRRQALKTESPPAGEAREKGPSPVVRSVPLAPGGYVFFELDNGQVYPVPVPKLELAPVVGSEALDNPTSAPNSWGRFAAAAGVTGNALSSELMRSLNWRLIVLPQYAALEEGRVSPEDQTPLTRDINLRLDSASRRSNNFLATTYGTSRPFRVKWTFTGTDVITGRSVPVRIGRGGPSGAIEVDTTSSPPSFELRVAFPDSNAAIYRLDVVGEVEDVFRNRGGIRHTIWSHYIKPQSDTSGTRLLSVLQLTSDQINEASRSPVQLDVDARLRNGAKRGYGQLLRRLLHTSSQDGRVTLDELQQLIQASGQFRAARN